MAGMLSACAHPVERKKPADLQVDGESRDPFKIADDLRTLDVAGYSGVTILSKSGGTALSGASNTETTVNLFGILSRV